MREIETISSRDNRRLVHARRVRDGKAPEQIFVEGRRLVGEALRSDLAIVDCFISESFEGEDLTTAVARRAAIARVPERLFASIADTDSPQGIIVIAERPVSSMDTIALRIGSGALPLAVFLSEINNPSNLGAILRTAEAAGVAGVVVSANSADVFSAKALRASMGASFRLPVCTGSDLDTAVRWAKEKGLVITAAAASASVSYRDIAWAAPRLLVFGSEAHGLSPSDLEKVDETISIAMEHNVESLNLAVSAGIILFEARRPASSPLTG